MAYSPPDTETVLPRMNRILKPRSIVVVGASADPRSFGGFVQGNLERYGYDGVLHLGVEALGPEGDVLQALLGVAPGGDVVRLQDQTR